MPTPMLHQRLPNLANAKLEGIYSQRQPGFSPHPVLKHRLQQHSDLKRSAGLLLSPTLPAVSFEQKGSRVAGAEAAADEGALRGNWLRPAPAYLDDLPPRLEDCRRRLVAADQELERCERATAGGPKVLGAVNYEADDGEDDLSGPLRVVEGQLQELTRKWQKDREAMQAKQAELEAQLREAEGAKKVLTAQVAELGAAVARAHEDVDQARGALQTVQGQADDLRASLGVSEAQASKLREEATEWSRKEAVLHAQATSLYSRLYQAQADVEHLRTNLEEVQRHRDVLQEAAQETSSELAAFQRQALQKKVAELSIKADEALVAELELEAKLEATEAAEASPRQAAFQKQALQKKVSELAVRADDVLQLETKLAAAEAAAEELMARLTARDALSAAVARVAAPVPEAAVAAAEHRAAAAEAKAKAAEARLAELEARMMQAHVEAAVSSALQRMPSEGGSTVALQASPSERTASAHHHDDASSEDAEELRTFVELMASFSPPLPQLAFAADAPPTRQHHDTQNLQPVRVYLNLEQGELTVVPLEPVGDGQRIALANLTDILQPAHVFPDTVVDLELAEGAAGPGAFAQGAHPGLRIVWADEHQATAFVAALNREHRVAPGSVLDVQHADPSEVGTT